MRRAAAAAAAAAAAGPGRARPVAPEPSVNPRATHASESCFTFVLLMCFSGL